MHSRKVLHYILFYKPYGVLSQFSQEAGHPALKEFGPFPATVYPVGRLDVDSEGLLLLTDDNLLKHRLSDPRFAHKRTYLVQVEGIPTEDSIQRLRVGIIIEGKKTRPADLELLHEDPRLAPRSVPIRHRESIPTSWLKITLREGRNRQVRKMTAAVGYPTLRLVRIAIGDLGLAGLLPGAWRSLSQAETSALIAWK